MSKRLAWLLGCCLLVWCPAASAQTHYITEKIQVTFRTGPAMDRKIIAMLNSGQALEIVERGDEWSLIRLPSGREGWVLTRLIQDEPPAKMQLAQLKERYDALLAQAGVPTEALKNLEKEKAALTRNLAQVRQQLSALTDAHDQLKMAAADAEAIREHRDRLAKELVAARTRNDALTREITTARSRNTIWWFVAGAGVLLLGFIIGLSMRSRRRRSSYY